MPRKGMSTLPFNLKNANKIIIKKTQKSLSILRYLSNKNIVGNLCLTKTDYVKLEHKSLGVFSYNVMLTSGFSGNVQREKNMNYM